MGERLVPRGLEKAWLVVLSTGLALAALFLVLGPVDGRLYNSVGIFAAIAILVASSRMKALRSAWFMLGLSQAAWAIGDLTYAFLDARPGPMPYPSLADLFYVAGYPLAILGAVFFLLDDLRGEMRKRVTLDSLIVGILGAMIAWELFFDRYVTATQDTGEWVALIYPIFDIAAFGVIAALILNGHRSTAAKLLTVAVSSLMFADILYGIDVIHDNYGEGAWYDIGWLLSYTFIAAAAWHPSATVVEEKTHSSTTATALAVSGVLLLEAAYLLDYINDTPSSIFLGLGGAAVIFFLLLARLRLEIDSARFKEQQFKALMNHASEAILISENGVYVDANLAAQELLGFSREEIIGREVGSFGPPERRADIPDMLRQMETGRTLKMQRTLIRKDGSHIHVESSVRKLPDGRYQGIVRDISERLAAERQLKASEQLLKIAFDAPTSGMVLGRVDGRLLKVNKAFADMLGYTPEELEGRTSSWYTHPEDVDKVREHMQDIIIGRTDRFSLEKRYIHKDGHVIPTHVDIAVTRKADGSPGIVVGHAVDLSKARQLEHQLWQSQKLEAVGQLAGGVAHDFNNILAIVLNYVAFVAEAIGPEHPALEDLNEITRAARKGTSLARQLLTFSRQDSWSDDSTNVEQSLSEMKEMLRRLIEEDIYITFDVRSGPDEVRLDPNHFDQLIMNLVMNAKDATPKGGRISLVAEHVDLDQQRGSLIPGGYVRIVVSDTGCGMTPEISEHIFEPFFTTKERGSGTGLGLATVYGMVQRAGGSIEVSSEEGKGSTFTLWLPLATPGSTRASTTEPVSRATDHLRGVHVLVVEDEPAVRASTVRLLNAEGLTVTEAGDAEEALEAYHTTPVDLIVSDVVMPGRSGVDLAHLVSIPVLLMSGHPQEMIEERGTIPPHATLLMKPFTRQALLTAVDEALAKRSTLSVADMGWTT